MQECVPYKKAIGLKYPEHIVLVVTLAPGDKVNVITLGWSMITSHQPPMMAVSIGNTRYSHEILSGSAEFVLAFPGRNMAREALYCGTHSGRKVDKIAGTGLKLASGKKVGVPLLKEAVANFELKLAGKLTTGDHTIFVGEVVESHRHVDPPERLYTLGPDYELGYPSWEKLQSG